MSDYFLIFDFILHELNCIGNLYQYIVYTYYFKYNINHKLVYTQIYRIIIIYSLFYISVSLYVKTKYLN